MTTTTYTVPDMTCGHCEASIKGELGPLDGVDSVDINLETKIVTVEGSASDEAMRAAIDEAGFDVAS